MVARRTARSLAIVGVLAALAAIGYALRWRRHPSPCPYSQRVWIDLPRPVISRSRLCGALEPQPGERILELGPGTGYYTGAIAGAVGPSGTVHAVDIQRPMVAELRTRLRERGYDNVAVVHGDGQALPYPDDSFDAAYLVLVLGEIPDGDRALAELERVLKPDGRLVVGESLPDPHFVTREMLRERVERQGFRFEDDTGMRGSYFARMAVPPSNSD